MLILVLANTKKFASMNNRSTCLLILSFLQLFWFSARAEAGHDAVAGKGVASSTDWLNCDAVSFDLGPIEYIMENVSGNVGDIVSMPVRVRNFTNVQALRCTFQYDSSELDFISVGNYGHSAFSANSFGLPSNPNIGPGFITHGMFYFIGDGISIADSTTIFEIKFRLKGPTGATSLVLLNDSRIAVEGLKKGNYKAGLISSGGEIIQKKLPPSIIVCPDYVVLQCNKQNNEALISNWLNSVQHNSLCSGVSITNNYDPLHFSDGCGITGRQTVSFFFKDDCEQTSACTANIYIEDNFPPVITQAAEDKIVEEDGRGNTEAFQEWLTAHGGAIAEDACGDVAWSHKTLSIQKGCGITSITTVAFTATDDCGKAVTTTAAFHIMNTNPPELTKGAQDIFIEYNGSYSIYSYQELGKWIWLHGYAEAATDLREIVWDYRYLSEEVGCGKTKTIIVEFIASDSCRLYSSSTTARIHFLDRTPPKFTYKALDDQEYCNSNNNYSNHQNFRYWINTHGYSHAEDNSGQVIWTYQVVDSTSAPGVNFIATVDFTASDECGNSAVTRAVFKAIMNGGPKIIQDPQDMAVEYNPDTRSQYEQWLNAHAYVQLNQEDSLLRWNYKYINYASIGSAPVNVLVEFTALNPCGFSTTFRSKFTTINPKELEFSKPPEDLILNCYIGQDEAFQAWLDSHGNAQLVGGCSAVTWKYRIMETKYSCYYKSKSYKVDFYAYDQCQNSTARKTASFIVNDDIPPVLIREAEDLVVDFETAKDGSAFDNWLKNHGNAMAEEQCGGISWNSVVEEYFPSLTNPVFAVVKFYASDECSNHSTSTRAIFRVLSPATLKIIKEAETTQVDPDGQGNTAEYESWLASNGNAEATSECGAITWTYNIIRASQGCGTAYSQIVDFIAKNECGDSSITRGIFTINPTPVPVITKEAESITIPYEKFWRENIYQKWLDAHGNAEAEVISGNITWQYFIPNSEYNCENNMTIHVTFVAYNDCYRYAQSTATFRVRPPSPPRIIKKAKDFVQEGQPYPDLQKYNAWLYSHGGAVALNADKELINLWTYRILESAPGCENTLKELVAFIAWDQCGLSDTTIATYQVIDTTAPRISKEATDLTVISDGSGNQAAYRAWLIAHGNAQAEEVNNIVNWSYEVVQSLPGCGNALTEIVDFIATDGCGQSSRTRASFNIIDSKSPAITMEAQYQTLESNIATNDSIFQSWLDHHGYATATDDSDSIFWRYEILDTETGCGGSKKVVVNFIASDTCGMSSISKAVFRIKDSTPPFIIQGAQDLTVPFNYASNQLDFEQWLLNNGNAVAEDKGGDVTWSYRLKETVLGNGNARSQTVDFIATDDCNLSSVSSAVFKIVDSTPPEITREATDLTVESDGQGNIEAYQAWLDAHGNADATGACGSITWHYEIVSAEEVCSATRMETVDFIATDACGLSARTSAIFTIVDSTPPTIIKEAQDLIVECGAADIQLEYEQWLLQFGNAEAEDAGGNVTWTYRITGTTTGNCNTKIEAVEFIATDDCNLSSVSSAVFKIVDSTPPEITREATDLTVESDGSGNADAYQASLNAHGNAEAADACGDITWHYEIVSAEEVCSATRMETVDFIATDACGLSSRTRATFKVADRTPPRIEKMARTVAVNCEQADVSTEFASWIATNGGAVAGDLSGEVSWSYTGTPSYLCKETPHFVVFTATDACGNTSTSRAFFNVIDNTAPVVIAPEDYTIDCNEDYRFGNPEIEDCSGYQITFQDFYIGNAACRYEETKVRRWTVTDACGNSTTAEQRIHRRDETAPNIWFVHPLLKGLEDGGELVVACNAIPNFGPDAVAAVDACGATGAIEVFSDNPGRYRSTGCAANDRHLNRIYYSWTAADLCGNESSIGLYLLIKDTIAPEIAPIPGEVHFNCGETPPFSQIKVSDCSEVDIQIFDRVSGTQCEDGYQITRTWIATDQCGNSNSSTQTAMMRPGSGNLAFISIPADIVIGQNGLAEFGEPLVRSLCPDGYELDYRDDSEVSLCEKILRRTWTATDACGNSVEATQNIIIKDLEAPQFAWVPEDQLVARMEDVPATLNPGVMEDGMFSLEFEEKSEDRSDGTTLITRTWTATDVCGNANSTHQHILVGSNAPIAFLWVQENQQLSCGDAPVFARPSVASNCGEMMLRFQDEIVELACASQLITRTWTARDACGNMTTAVQQIQIADLQAPLFTWVPPGQIYYCGEELHFDEPEVTDGCSQVEISFRDVVKGQGNCAADYWVTRTWTAKDACGNTSSASSTNWVQSATPQNILQKTPPAEYGNTISSSEVGALKVFPNPVRQEQLTLELNTTLAGDAVIRLINIMGQEVYRSEAGLTKGVNRLWINPSHLATGSYFVIVRLPDGRQLMAPLVRQ